MRVAVIAHPNSQKPRIETDLLETLHVYVAEPPLEGKANRAVAAALADYFRTKRSNVLLVSGERSKNKVFQIATP
jgi:uncharacterized protein